MFLARQPPHWAMASSFTRFLDHTQRRITVGRTPLDDWSARRRDLYLTTHNTHNKQTYMPPGGFEPTTSAGEQPLGPTLTILMAVLFYHIRIFILSHNWTGEPSNQNYHHHHHHNHHHVPEGLGVFPVPWSSRWIWSLHLFFGRPTFLRPFGLYCSACFGSLFVSILCTCCSHFFWYCFISFTMFCVPAFFPNTLIDFLTHWFSRLLQLKLQQTGEGEGDSPAP